MKKLRADVLVFASLVFAAFLFLANAPVSLHPPSVPIPAELFGMHIHRLATVTPWPTVSFGTWRLWDAYVAWPNLEPQKGKWNFSNLDLYVTQAEQHHVEILLPLALSPPWASARPTEQQTGTPAGNAAEPKNIADWEDYVRTIATRYKGRIHYYEGWNEPSSKIFWSGSIPQMVELACSTYSIIKRVDPAAQVSSPPYSSKSGLISFEAYLRAGGGKCADIIGYHLYVAPGPPEEMVGLIQQVKEIMARNGAANKPLWNTESGWEIQNKQSVVKQGLSPDEAASYLARAFVLSWASGVSRFYWYSWDNYVTGLVDHDGKTLKSPAIAYGEIQKWLIGTRMDSCDTDANGTWTCAISRNGGYRGWIVWNPTRTPNLTPPGSWKVKQVRDLAGKTEPMHPERPSIPIGASPVILESQGQ